MGHSEIEEYQSEIRIVELKPTAWKKYKKLRLEALHYDPSAFADSYREGRGKPKEVWQERLKLSEKGKALKIFFAQQKSELAGMLGVEFDLRDKRLHVAKLRELYVAPEFRSYGLGGKLVEHALLCIQKKVKRIKKIALSVNKTQLSAVKLYQSLGFEIVGLQKKEIKIHGYFVDQYIMEKYF